MTAEELQHLLKGATWFSRFGGPAATIRDLLDDSAGWDWLPTAHDQPDPIHGDTFVKLASDLGRDEQRRAAEVAAASTTLHSLRPVAECVPGLNCGPHDLTVAAKGAAVYSARMAAREIVIERPGFWCDVVRLFYDGYWPCGRDDAGKLVVY